MGKLLPKRKPRTQDNGCGYFMWKDDLRLRLNSSPGPSTPRSSSPGPVGSAPSLGKVECSNCKFLAEKIKIL
ncbi:hypothetical protein Tco_1128703 [Tanacetum coccineum]